MADGTGLVRCVGRDSLTLSSCLLSGMILSQFGKVQQPDTIAMVGSSDTALSELGFLRRSQRFGFVP